MKKTIIITLLSIVISIPTYAQIVPIGPDFTQEWNLNNWPFNNVFGSSWSNNDLISGTEIPLFSYTINNMIDDVLISNNNFYTYPISASFAGCRVRVKGEIVVRTLVGPLYDCFQNETNKNERQIVVADIFNKVKTELINNSIHPSLIDKTLISITTENGKYGKIYVVTISYYYWKQVPCNTSDY